MKSVNDVGDNYVASPLRVMAGMEDNNDDGDNGDSEKESESEEEAKFDE